MRRFNIIHFLSSFWWFFRPIFILFFLYLTGDAFFRWDGFSYSGTFAEFLPSAALAAILWFLTAVFTALLLSITGAALRSLNKLTGWNVTTQHYLLFTILFLSSGILTWFVKRHILHLGITIQITLIEFACAVTIAVFATWLLRFKAKQWIDVIQNHISPLVLLYGILVILSVPFVAYHAWGKHSDTIQANNLTQSYAAAENKPNIILVTFDALAARNMSVYGYHRQTTPFIDEWAKKASLFTNLKAAGTLTALTTASLMTGKRTWTHNTFQLHSFDTLNSNIESLPVILKKNGYYTMALAPSRYSSEIVKSIGVPNGFDFTTPFHELLSSNSLHGHIDGILASFFDGKIRLHEWVIQGDFILAELLILTNRHRDVSVIDRPAEKVFNRFISHIQDNPQEPYFAWIHLFPPHFPYLPPEPYMGMINPSSELRGSVDQYNALLKVDQYLIGSLPIEEVQPQVDILMDRYDELIMYCDKQFEDFIKTLEALDKSGKTIVIVSTDHGETFEPDEMGHGGSPREAVSHIPLIIREAGQNKQNIINNLVEQVDIPSTILALAHIQLPSWMEGRSLVPLMRGKKLPEQPAFSVDFQKNPSGEMISQGTVAVYEGDYKLIHDLGKKTSQLFNIKNDPYEQNNLINNKPAVGQHLLNFIMDEINKANKAFKKRQSVQ